MAELKTKLTSASVDDFLDAIENDQIREDCRTIATVLENATKTKGEMWGTSIIGFGRYQYKYSDGRSMEWMKVGFAPRKQNIVLYLVSGFDSYEDLLSQLGKHSRSKGQGGCLYVKRLSDVHLPTLKKLVKNSVAKVNQMDKENRSARKAG
jgi:Domain of unknown function (DU1801).